MVQRRHNFARRNSGFTLIELLLALFMAAILTVSLVRSLKIAYTAKAAADRVLEPPRTAEIAMEMLRADFQSAVTPSASALTTTYAYSVSSLGTGMDSIGATTPTITSGTTSGTTSGSTSATTSGNLAGPFVGGSTGLIQLSAEVDDIVFFTTADSPQDIGANSEIKQVEYTVDDVQDLVTGVTTPALVRLTTRDLLDDDPINDVTPDEEIVCRGVVEFACQYYDGEDWYDTWDSTENNNDLPAAVQVTLALLRPTAQDPDRVLTFSRVFTLPCSGVTFDSSINPQIGGSGANGGDTLGGL
jgi:prepilin-type N-terminal cleavage/methylation domain-containing protein